MVDPPAQARVSQADLRQRIRDHYTGDEAAFTAERMAAAGIEAHDRAAIAATASAWVAQLRRRSKPSLMEQFFLSYGLDIPAGTALMSLAEALPRVADRSTARAVVADKLRGVDWTGSIKASSLRMTLLAHTLAWVARLVPGANDSPWIRAGKRPLQGPILFATRAAVARFGRQFVLGAKVDEALRRAEGDLARGYTHSIDMLGEAARTEADALAYFAAYRQAIADLKPHCQSPDLRANPGISVKLSALHARYEATQIEATWQVLLPRVLELARLAADANMGLNIDAEEMDRLELSLDIIDALLRHPELKAWPGLGVVVQAYGFRAPHVLDWLHAMAVEQDRRLMVRLVKGAYWDSEIKHAQVQGLRGFPVLTCKAHTDLAYLACARQLLAMSERIYPQFATHNAHSMAAVLHFAGKDRTRFEFQRLHGMGAALHERVKTLAGTRCRIYAPVGAQRELLAYLVRRLLENGANSSFVKQLADRRMTAAQVARDPFTDLRGAANPALAQPPELFAPARENSHGWDLADTRALEALMAERERFADHTWRASCLPDPAPARSLAGKVTNPARPREAVGEVHWAGEREVQRSLGSAHAHFPAWSARPVGERAACLETFADALQSHTAEFAALLGREAGKTLADALAEIREAVDFARYYAAQARALPTQARARGVVVCISPWNFPLAIFSGQILAALVTGNTVVAKPAEQTPLVAYRAAQLMLGAGIDAEALHLLPGGGDIGDQLTRDPRVAAVCFTGSLATARIIAGAMAGRLPATAPLIAETGGINSMIIDGTALLEQAVRDVLTSAFQSAGQRCSALRIVYIQADIAERFIDMLTGAMDLLQVGDPWQLATDVGPVIDDDALERIGEHIEHMRTRGQVLKTVSVAKGGRFVGPALIRVSGIEALTEETFGPVLHVASYPAEDLAKVIDAINGAGYGLTFGLHTRLAGRQADVAERIRAGNVYINRNQIGAIVGSQPFGGCGLSGTGPKAGGPHYLPRLCTLTTTHEDTAPDAHARAPLGEPLDEDVWQTALTRLARLGDGPGAALSRHCLQVLGALLEDFPERLETRRLPGPVGEANTLTYMPRGLVVCLGPSARALRRQTLCALLHGNRVLAVGAGAAQLDSALHQADLPFVGLDGHLPPAFLNCRTPLHAVCCIADDELLRSYRQALAERPGMLVPLLTELEFGAMLTHEKSISTDTTAAGGNASLLAMD